MTGVQAGFFLVPIAALTVQVDPLGGVLWGCGRIDPAEVQDAAAAGEFEERAWDQVKDELHGPASHGFHVRRIAHFLQYGWPDDEHHIRVAVDGLNSRQPVRIDNGNHRLAAAIIGSGAPVKLLLYYFDVDEIQRYLPGSIAI